MPSNYQGRPGKVAQAQAPVIACPVGTDAPNAASVNKPLQTLCDYVAYLQQYAATSGAQQPNAQTLVVNGDPALGTYPTLAVGSRACLWEAIVTVGASKVTARIYLTAAGAMEHVHNCYWDKAASLWRADPTNTEATFFKAVVAGPGGPALFAAANNVNGWADGAWALVAKVSGSNGLAIADGTLSLVGTTAGATGSNPPAATPVANAICAKNTCKAWGTVICGTSGPTLIEGFNVASISRQNVGTDLWGNPIWSIRVTFAAPMQSAAYSVHLTACDNTRPDLVHLPTAFLKSPSTLDIVLRNPGQKFFDDPSVLTLGVDFQVFGRQDS